MNTSGKRQSSFVESSANSLGIGNLLHVAEGFAHIRYFCSPAENENLIQRVPLTSIRSVSLQPQTRVYFKNTETGVVEVGRVLDHQVRDDCYLVRFPNNDSRMLHSQQLSVRCRLPIREPTDHLAFQVNETAFWHAGRSNLVRHLMQQHQASRGLSALICSSIEIVAHQAFAVHKVLLDPFQRYLLADEVGLGKTIEAAALIKQFVIDQPLSHNILILVPDVLVLQWKQELIHRFHLRSEIDRSILVVASSNLEAIAKSIEDAKMIVIDEAHHLCSWAWSASESKKAIYDHVRKATGNLKIRVLLLSATPVLHNEKSFLAMLHLLDPQVYSLDQIEKFTERVRLRQEIAERLTDLREDESNFFLEDTLRVLGELLSEDREFMSMRDELARMIAGDVGENDSARATLIRRIRSHVSDLWRLHRRIIRSRRNSLTEVYLPGRAGSRRVGYQCHSQRDLALAVESLRVSLSSSLYNALPETRQQATDLCWHMEELAGSEPQYAQKLAMRRLAMDSNDEVCQRPLCDGEAEALMQIVNAARDYDEREKLKALLDLITSSLSGVSCVVFTSARKTADSVYEFLHQNLRGSQVLRHMLAGSDWTQFKSDAGNYVLVCDHTAEERLNLQKRGGKANRGHTSLTR